ncbi:putative Meiosis protein SPO22/ZIP4 like-domain-containing protein [Seiridium unicorne]|uniref:Meiosis protein SPO22/ZIP4 like-domain-containing protein n=1 Tax=Seiridium unicorne TaxID=138068 RepID=A0ABR2USV3_9PEZI
MASGPNSGGTSKKDKRVDTIIAFAQDMHEKLPNLKDESDVRHVIDELENQIRTLKSHTLQGPRWNDQLDLVGTDLWNTCVRLTHNSNEHSASVRRALVLTRVLAFQILVLAQGTNSNEPDRLIRLAKLAIKTGRSCIDANEIDFALLSLQKAVDYNGLLQNMQDRLSEDEQAICTKLEAEYFILRTVASWRDGRLDVAEHMYSKSESLRQRLGLASTETLADALFEMANDSLGKRDFSMASKWLERAYELINSQDLEQLSREAIELRLSISQALIHSLLGLNTDESFRAAENHVACIESELGDTFVVLLLRLEVLQKAPGEVFDSEAYADVLRRIIRTASLTDPIFNLIINHIRKLDDKSPTLAPPLLDQFIFDQVIPSEKTEWIERCILLRVILSTNRRDFPTDIDVLESVFDRVSASTGRPLAVDPALAILTLIWKKVEATSAQSQLDLCESWCRLASHSLLDKCGPVNAGKIARKSLVCALERNDLDKAKETFLSMNEGVQSQPMTMYLAHKLALRVGDPVMASKCIDAVSKSAAKDPKFLYACCLDAQHSGDKLCTLKALKLLADKYELSQDCEIHFPALLRSMIRVQTSLIDSKEASHVGPGLVVDDLCKAFEAVVTSLQSEQRDRDGSKLFTVAELTWFSKNAYNLGVKHTPDWDLRCTIRICISCVSIMQYYPNDLPNHDVGDISLRAMFCHFMIATAYIALARAEDNVEVQLQDYLNSRKHTKAFETQLEGTVQHDDECSNDLVIKLTTLLVFDFEAAVNLKSWDELSLQFKLESFNSEKLAKYMRCLLRITMSDAELSSKLVEEICNMVKQAAKTQKPFPENELVWFATTTFNQAVDYNLTKDDELCQKWMGRQVRTAKTSIRSMMLIGLTREFNELVNMSASDLETWLKEESSESAGWSKEDGSGETIGHERKIIDILKKNPKKDPEKYEQDDIDHMRKVVAYCKRHLAQESKAKQDPNSKSARSLKNWGHDPQKA